MRLTQSASISKQRKNQRLSNSRARKKHKRLDAICENVYNRNHRGVDAESSECNVRGRLAGSESELRRSTRVRRAPVVLDSSPPPAKKRRRIGNKSGTDSVERVKTKDEMKIDSPCSTSKDMEEEPAGWRSRLRSRSKNVSFGARGKGDLSPRGKRKLFQDLDGFKEEPKLDDKEEGLESGKLTVVKSKRPGRVKASNVLRSARQEIESYSVKEDDKEKNEVEVLENNDEEDPLLLKSGAGCESEREIKDGDPKQLVEKEEGDVPMGLQLEDCIGNENVETMELDKQVELPESVEAGEIQRDTVEIDGIPTDQAEEGGCHDKPLEDENAMKVDKTNCASTDTLGKLHIKEGRRCGLCGAGTDGKPPKKLLQDGTGSDNEAYSGSSASEEPNYDVWDGFGNEPGWLGRLLGPINDRFGIAGIWVHQHCAVWSPEVYFAGLGCLKNVRAALCRGRVLKCSRCGRPGATIGCRVDRCPKTYHLPCARANGCIFDHRKFLIACTDHRHLFQPHGSQYLYRIKKMKAKKMKLEMRKLSNDACRKDLEVEEKWLENCGEDEEFLKRESKRLHRDLLRIAPVYIGGSNCESEIQFQGWESVAGLQDVIRCMKEVVILPLLYPEFFSNLGLTPPRGILLHGYPGTGKTLVVRALIGSCARGDKRIAYFARKGADCLGKYVGDAERQLRLLFQVAEKSQPSIIFFDEIDGLAPCRTRQQDQTHSSVVSTLLALLDGLKSRGSVVVIGATNRPDAVDPALRRPGRFDREIYFPLPSVMDRAAILSLHTQRWPKPITGSLLTWIARRTVGFAGADLQALCTQAAIIALRRNCPFQELLSAAGEKSLHGKRPPLPAFTVEERDWLEALSCAPPPCSQREAGMAANDVVSSPLHTHLIPCLLQPLSILLVSLYLDERLWLPPSLSKAAILVKNVIISALDKKKVRSDHWWSHVNDLLQEADVVREIENSLSHASILIGEASYASFDALDADSDDDSLKFGHSKVQQIDTRTSLLQNISYGSEKKSGFRILISGSPRSGQRYLASCLLHCFVGNVEIRKVDLATISQEGRGDVVQGITRILMRCASVGLCMIFMPRIDLWAIETCHQVGEMGSDSSSTNLELSEENKSCLTHSEVEKENQSCARVCESAEMAEPQDAAPRASHIWSSFIEQVESICVSTSLMILATSEVPVPLLPLRIRQFFKSDTLKCSLSTPVVDTVPRFSVQIDGKFNHDMVINSSAAELSKDSVQQFVQLIHHKIHIHVSSCKEDKACYTIDGDAEMVCQSTNPGSTNQQGKTECPDNSVMKVALPPINRTPKGKSSLLLAISTFGYQILRYPHFAELCWVTSNLKDGPCADINGPWKGWPFNSCIVRPSNSSEKVAVACSSSNIKSKEKSGLVRGLIAVGLSAYRGMYTSLREVSSEVRKVLELLVGEINAKIQAGKDRYQFIRLLSQVAYLEDMVNSWAYTLQSLEVDAQMTVANPVLSSLGSLDNYNSCKGDSPRSGECKPDASNKSSHEPEVLEESSHGFTAKTIECVDLDKGGGDFCHPIFEGRNAVVEGSPEQMVLHHSATDIHFHSSAVTADPLDGKLLNEQNGINPEPCRSENPGNHTGIDGGIGALQHSNGFACSDSDILLEDGPFGSGELAGVKLSCSGKDCDKYNGLSAKGTGIPSKDGNPNSDELNADINFSSNKTPSLSTDSGVVCFYRCCSQCLFNFHHLMQKILIYEWGLKGNDWTVEDVHDVVASLSVNLRSLVGRLCVAENSANSFAKLFEHQEMGTCQCKSSGNGLIMPMECSCHSRSKGATAKANLSRNPQHGLDSKFIYRDGVLAPLDSDKDVSFHCKFETLCLCSLIEWIVMTKRP
uniref:PHD-type domain-containing protein n=1 Tax=Davidia involucrata TaxID=16924 RepID=A0A5B6YIA8_DAVIN